MTSEDRQSSATAASMIYVTCATHREATKIVRTLVSERLAACGNIIDGVHSHYWWDGEVQEESEAVLILKTATGKVDALTARIKELHSYDVPCIVELPLARGNAEYLAWIAAETAKTAE